LTKKVWVFGDYKQAEAMVVAWRGPVPFLKTWFEQKKDVHINVAKMIGKIVQDSKLQMPSKLWMTCPWQEIPKESKERELSKRTVHANNYDMGVMKYSLITGLPVKYARMLQDMYHSLFPEIRGNYHRWIREELIKTHTLENPLGWRRRFYDLIKYGTVDQDVLRKGYAWYPQSTVGLMTIKWWYRVCEIFKENLPEAIMTPTNIRRQGLDVQLQVHDSIGAVVPDDRESIDYAVKKMDELGSIPLLINNEILDIPRDFKIGDSWGTLKDYNGGVS